MPHVYPYVFISSYVSVSVSTNDTVLDKSLMSTFTAWDNLPSYNMVCWIVLHFYAKCIIILTIVFVFLDKKSFKWKGITTTIFGSSRSNNSGQIRFYYLGTSKWCWSDCEYYHMHNHAFVLWWENITFCFSQIITDFECLPFSCHIADLMVMFFLSSV